MRTRPTIHQPLRQRPHGLDSSGSRYSRVSACGSTTVPSEFPRIDTTAAREQFRSQLLDLVSSVLNLYWNLVSATDESKARQQALEIAQKFLDDTQKEIAAQALPAVQLPRAEAEVSMRRQELLIAQANIRQQEVLLKEAISHSEDPLLEASAIVPVDRIEIPAGDDLPPLRQLVATAMARRPDVAVAKYRDQTTEMNLIGTTNPLLPTANVTLQTYNRGVGGDGHVIQGEPPNAYFVGGYSNAFAQVFQHDFSNYYSGFSFSAPTGNRGAQADYGIDQLQYRQSQVGAQKDINSIVVDVAAGMSALRQARARYSAAQDTRTLQEQLLSADRQRFTSGGGGATFDTIMVDDRASGHRPDRRTDCPLVLLSRAHLPRPGAGGDSRAEPHLARRGTQRPRRAPVANARHRRGAAASLTAWIPPHRIELGGVVPRGPCRQTRRSAPVIGKFCAPSCVSTSRPASRWGREPFRAAAASL